MRTIYYGGEFMRLHDNGQIERPGRCGPSEHWRVVGAVERNNFGNVTRRYSLADILARGPDIPWEFKNGKQRTFMRDFDHGTMREWRSPNHRISY